MVKPNEIFHSAFLIEKTKQFQITSSKFQNYFFQKNLHFRFGTN